MTATLCAGKTTSGGIPRPWWGGLLRGRSLLHTCTGQPRVDTGSAMPQDACRLVLSQEFATVVASCRSFHFDKKNVGSQSCRFCKLDTYFKITSIYLKCDKTVPQRPFWRSRACLMLVSLSKFAVFTTRSQIFGLRLIEREIEKRVVGGGDKLGHGGQVNITTEGPCLVHARFN